ncbi:transposase [Vibrio sp. N418]|uniref:transposase n=1 Tax=Vibrio sp. (strain N418) TaxID=701176 RepID=UPI00021BE8F4|nr:transposase [Vibrio sp. N418]EGU37426.1 transposase [Vibrio sp. N418]
MAKHRNPAYTEEFRKEAVRLSELPGKTAVSVAQELGISAQQIRNWKRQFTRLSDKQFNTLDGVDYSKKESEEIRALRLENKRLKDEIEFLKKVSKSRKPPKGVIIHSDRGVQYRAYEYHDFMLEHGGVLSMSRKGKC